MCVTSRNPSQAGAMSMNRGAEGPVVMRARMRDHAAKMRKSSSLDLATKAKIGSNSRRQRLLYNSGGTHLAFWQAATLFSISRVKIELAFKMCARRASAGRKSMSECNIPWKKSPKRGGGEKERASIQNGAFVYVLRDIAGMCRCLDIL